MTIIASYLSVKDSAASPSGGFYAQYSTDAGNNTGWVVFSGSYLQTLEPALYSNANAFYGVNVKYRINASQLVNENVFFPAEVKASYLLEPSLFINGNLFYQATISRELNQGNRGYTADYNLKNFIANYKQRNYTAKQ